MKVALLEPVAWRTPPGAYGPWELVVSLLAEGLVARGVDVTLCATLDSRTAATLDGVCPRPHNEDRSLDGRVWEALHIAHCLERSADFDLVHNHLDRLPLAMSGLCRSPMLTTIHGVGDTRILPAYQASTSAFVSTSDADRVPGLTYIATVHHGIDATQRPYEPNSGPGLVAVGRIHPDNATADAIDIAQRAGRPLTICGPIHDDAYYAEEVAPRVDGETVRYLGNIGGAQRAAVVGQAAALLHPLGFDEPFGLSVIEAMACGTPVVGYRRGALVETVTDGRSSIERRIRVVNFAWYDETSEIVANQPHQQEISRSLRDRADAPEEAVRGSDHAVPIVNQCEVVLGLFLVGGLR